MIGFKFLPVLQLLIGKVGKKQILAIHRVNVTVERSTVSVGA